MMATLTKMNTKIESAKKRIHQDPIDPKKQKTDQMTNKLIQSKESSEIITKENLLTDITECTSLSTQPTRRQSSKSTPKTANSRRRSRKWPDSSKSRMPNYTSITPARRNS